MFFFLIQCTSVYTNHGIGYFSKYSHWLIQPIGLFQSINFWNMNVLYIIDYIESTQIYDFPVELNNLYTFNHVIFILQSNIDFRSINDCWFIRKIFKYKMYSNFPIILNYKNMGMQFLRKQLIDRNNYNFSVLNGRICKIDEKEKTKCSLILCYIIWYKSLNWL